MEPTYAHSVEMFTARRSLRRRDVKSARETKRELNKAINRFDSNTLQTLLKAAMDELTD